VDNAARLQASDERSPSFDGFPRGRVYFSGGLKAAEIVFAVLLSR